MYYHDHPSLDIPSSSSPPKHKMVAHLHCLGSCLCPGCPLPRLLGLPPLGLLGLALAALRLYGLFRNLCWLAVMCCKTECEIKTRPWNQTTQQG